MFVNEYKILYINDKKCFKVNRKIFPLPKS